MERTDCDRFITITHILNSSIIPFQVFPNPVRNSLYITNPVHDLTQDVNVFNSHGEQVAVNYSVINNGEYIELNTSALPPAVYYVEVFTGKEKVVRRFVKE